MQSDKLGSGLARRQLLLYATAQIKDVSVHACFCCVVHAHVDMLGNILFHHVTCTAVLHSAHHGSMQIVKHVCKFATSAKVYSLCRAVLDMAMSIVHQQKR